MKIYFLMAPLGVASYAALALAFLTGILKFRFNIRWISLKWHIWLGAAALVLATLHLAAAVIVNL